MYRKLQKSGVRILHTGASFNSSRPLCAILGGVGPMAGLKLHEKVIRYSATLCDQDHMELIHLSTPIADRTKFLLTNEGANPGEDMFVAARGLGELATIRRKYVVAGVPCNTFHAPACWDRMRHLTMEWNKRIQTHHGQPSSQILPGQIHLVHMLKETVAYCTGLGAEKIGLLSTTGTRQTGVYKNMFQSVGMDVVEVDEDVQEQVHDAIYNSDDGIKALDSACPRVINAFRDFVMQIKAKGATAVILGCTEIPMALPEKEFEGVTLVDPMDVLARRLIMSVGSLCEEEKKFVSYTFHEFDDLL